MYIEELFRHYRSIAVLLDSERKQYNIRESISEYVFSNFTTLDAGIILNKIDENYFCISPSIREVIDILRDYLKVETSFLSWFKVSNAVNNHFYSGSIIWLREITIPKFYDYSDLVNKVKHIRVNKHDMYKNTQSGMMTIDMIIHLKGKL